MEIITKDEARARGLKKYYTGIVCKQGHDSERYTRDGSCVTCQIASENKRRNENPKRAKNIQLRLRYGITIEEFDQLMKDQNGVCAICKQPETRKGRSGEVQNLCVDHDHETGFIRGLLCHYCNKILVEKFNNRPDLFVNAANYLIKANKAQNGKITIFEFS